MQWLVVQARKISDQIGADNVASSYFPDQQKKAIGSLDSFGYDEAAQYVYGCTYPDWKKLHQKETTAEQMDRYNASKYIHAKHDINILAARSSKSDGYKLPPGAPVEHNERVQVCTRGQAQQKSLLSDVCCQDVDFLMFPTARVAQSLNSSQKMPGPPEGDLALRIGILTISDRASINGYETGDLSGPAVERTMTAQINGR